MPIKHFSRIIQNQSCFRTNSSFAGIYQYCSGHPKYRDNVMKLVILSYSMYKSCPFAKYHLFCLGTERNRFFFCENSVNSKFSHILRIFKHSVTSILCAVKCNGIVEIFINVIMLKSIKGRLV